MVGQKAAGTVDGAGETRCDRLMDWDRAGVVLVLRHRLVLLLFSALSFALLVLTITLRHLLLLLPHDMLLAQMLFFDLPLAIEPRGGLWWLVVHVSER
jgi:hypothetical protein